VPVVKTRSVLSGMPVKEAMRRQMIFAGAAESVDRGISRLIKYESEVILIAEANEQVTGIVSKTDLTAAFYIGLPLDTALGDIMVGPLIGCYPDDPLEDALETMNRSGVHQLCVQGAERGRIVGLLTYGDILSQVYRYCRRCRQSRTRQFEQTTDGRVPPEMRVAELMTPEVIGCGIDDDLGHVMEELSARRRRALLVNDRSGRPAGVISKTDLMLAWHRGVDPGTTAGKVMNAPVRSCHLHATLSEALKLMLLGDMSRIFVHDADLARMVGVLSLADAANNRSGTCRACVSSRYVGGG
jgi:CBS domain-containing protein